MDLDKNLEKLLNRTDEGTRSLLRNRVARLKPELKIKPNNLKELVQQILDHDGFNVPHDHDVAHTSDAAYGIREVKLGDEYRIKYLDVIDLMQEIRTAKTARKVLSLYRDLEKTYEELISMEREVIQKVKSKIGKKPDYIE